MKTALAIPALLAGLMLASPAGAGDKDLFGALLGGAGGAVLGAQLGKGHGRLAATAAGTFIGATIGHSVGRSLAHADTVYATRHGGHRSHVNVPQRHYYSAHDGYRYGHGYRQSDYYRGHVYSYAPPRVVYYEAPVRPAYVVAPPVVTYRSTAEYCREYTAPIVIGGSEVMGYGQACRRPDGSWKLGPLQPEQ
jgi:surface antigen